MSLVSSKRMEDIIHQWVKIIHCQFDVRLTSYNNRVRNQDQLICGNKISQAERASDRSIWENDRETTTIDNLRISINNWGPLDTHHSCRQLSILQSHNLFPPISEGSESLPWKYGFHRCPSTHLVFRWCRWQPIWCASAAWIGTICFPIFIPPTTTVSTSRSWFVLWTGSVNRAISCRIEGRPPVLTWLARALWGTLRARSIIGIRCNCSSVIMDAELTSKCWQKRWLLLGFFPSTFSIVVLLEKFFNLCIGLWTYWAVQLV